VEEGGPPAGGPGEGSVINGDPNPEA
jgi:hypothetical protein